MDNFKALYFASVSRGAKVKDERQMYLAFPYFGSSRPIVYLPWTAQLNMV